MKEKEIYLAGGCFWGTEHYFKQIEGVVETEVGFANGHTENPTYKEVYTDTTGYAETVRVRYNPDVVSLSFLLQMFFKAIDPTSLNKQGHDEGTRYRTGIYYTDSEDLPVIEKVFAEEQKNYQQPLAVEKQSLKNFYTAEEYHQDYLDKNPTGYCHLPQSLFEFAKKAKMHRSIKGMLLCLMTMACVLTVSAQSIYDFKVKDDAGKDVSLSDYKGKVLLIVNTATRCGFTPQYTELEALYEKYRNEGFEILDFPCNQFGQQAPGTIQEIHQYCTANFDIQFPQFDKIEVNGDNAHPLYVWLKAQKGFGGFDVEDQRGKMMDGMLRRQDADYDKKSDIKWNFTKFLVSRDGRVLKRYEPTDKMTDIETDICLEVNPVLSSIMARRSIRKYLDKQVEHEKLEVVVRAGINAPSGMNAQPWIVRVVEDQKLIADVTEIYKKENAEQVKRDKDFKNMFRNAPNLICVCTPANGGGELDAGLLGENMMLAAQSIGLGTCCLGGPVRFLLSNAKCKFFLDRLDIPADYKLNYIIAIGYPDEQPDAKPRDASKVKFIK